MDRIALWQALAFTFSLDELRNPAGDSEGWMVEYLPQWREIMDILAAADVFLEKTGYLSAGRSHLCRVRFVEFELHRLYFMLTHEFFIPPHPKAFALEPLDQLKPNDSRFELHEKVIGRINEFRLASPGFLALPLNGPADSQPTSNNSVATCL